MVVGESSVKEEEGLRVVDPINICVCTNISLNIDFVGLLVKSSCYLIKGCLKKFTILSSRDKVVWRGGGRIGKIKFFLHNPYI